MCAQFGKMPGKTAVAASDFKYTVTGLYVEQPYCGWPDQVIVKRVTGFPHVIVPEFSILLPSFLIFLL